MNRLRLLFYFTSVGIAVGYFFAFLLFFFTQFEMLADQSLVIFVWTVYGIMTGLYFKRINRKYTLLYIAREVLHASSLNQVKIPFIIAVVVINLVNLYIILTLSKYQKVYTKDELKALKEKEVKLSDLRESGAIEQDADVVILLNREDYQDKEKEEEVQNEIELIIAKHRNGEIGSIKLNFIKEYSRFLDLQTERDKELFNG